MSDSMWDTLREDFKALQESAPSIQKHRVSALREAALRLDTIEDAQFLLTVAKEIVKLQRRVLTLEMRTGSAELADMHPVG